MTDRDALFAAILAHPDEDTPRLAFADYLEENGEGEYAAFIRKQIELAKVPEWDPLWVRAWNLDRDAITGRGFDAFKPPLAAGLGWPTLESFRRGFPWHVQSTEVEPFLAGAEALFGAIPLQALTVKAGHDRWREPADLSALFASPHLAHLRRLDFSLTRFNPDTARQLGESPHLSNLRELGFEFATLDPGAARELIASPLAARLESLEFRTTIVVWPGIADGLLAAGGPHRLRRLRFISFNNTSYFGSHREFDAPLLRGLRELEISKCQMGGDHVRALCESAAARELESLTLNQVIPGVPGVKALVGCEALAGLKCLRLGGNRLGPVAAKSLARSPHLSGLRVLDLSNNPLGDKGAIELAQAPWLKDLASLELMHCDIGDAGAEALGEALNPESLVNLKIYVYSHRAKQSDAVKQKLRDKFGRVFL